MYLEQIFNNNYDILQKVYKNSKDTCNSFQKYLEKL